MKLREKPSYTSGFSSMPPPKGQLKDWTEGQVPAGLHAQWTLSTTYDGRSARGSPERWRNPSCWLPACPTVPTDAYTHVGGLDHAYIIGTIPNGQGDGFHPLLHHIHYLRLLQRRHLEGGERRLGLCGPSRGNSCNLHFAALKGAATG